MFLFLENADELEEFPLTMCSGSHPVKKTSGKKVTSQSSLNSKLYHSCLLGTPRSSLDLFGDLGL